MQSRKDAKFEDRDIVKRKRNVALELVGRFTAYFSFGGVKDDLV